jgi:hypothetical protein
LRDACRMSAVSEPRGCGTRSVQAATGGRRPFRPGAAHRGEAAAAHSPAAGPGVAEATLPRRSRGSSATPRALPPSDECTGAGSLQGRCCGSRGNLRGGPTTSGGRSSRAPTTPSRGSTPSLAAPPPRRQRAAAKDPTRDRKTGFRRISVPAAAGGQAVGEPAPPPETGCGMRNASQRTDHWKEAPRRGAVSGARKNSRSPPPARGGSNRRPRNVRGDHPRTGWSATGPRNC